MGRALRCDNGSVRGRCELLSRSDISQRQGTPVSQCHRRRILRCPSWPTGGFAVGRTELFGNRNYRYTEHRIVEAEFVNVIGDFRTVGGIRTADIDGEIMQLLAEWKQDQPALLQRFDRNRDGVLSQGEWEIARAAARRQIEQRPPQPGAPNLNVLVHPPDNRPYLIAACDLGKLARRSRLGAAGLIVAFLVAVGALARLLLGPA